MLAAYNYNARVDWLNSITVDQNIGAEVKLRKINDKICVACKINLK